MNKSTRCVECSDQIKASNVSHKIYTTTGMEKTVCEKCFQKACDLLIAEMSEMENIH